MSTTENYVFLKLNRKLRGKKPGIIRVQRAGDGKIKDKYWRDRLEDSKIDNCCEIVEMEKPKTKKRKIENG